MFSDSAPVFDHKGDFLYFASGRSFNPQYGDDSTWIYGGTQVLVAVPLRNDVRSPYLPKLEEEPFGDAKKTVAAPDTSVTGLRAALAAP